jgi:hypothetical protein
VLQSWKEIATYLGVSVRSAQRWETSGLPVHRQGTGTKARTFAYADELRRWRATTSIHVLEASTSGPQTSEPPAPVERRWRGWLTAGALALMALAAIVWLAGLLPMSRVPHGWTLEGSRLRVVDSRDRFCWDKQLPPFNQIYDDWAQDKVVVADIDGDGRTEVLFNYLPEPAATGGSLMCFEQNGKLRWQQRFGGPKTFGDRTFDASYCGRFVRPVRVGGRLLLLTVANHHIWYPSQVALLDPRNGRVVEQYWHPGAIYRYVLHDLDRDGHDELLLAGVNNPGNGLGHAALAVLKLPFSGAPHRAPAPDDPLPPLSGGGEWAYLMFPTPDVDAIMGVLPAVALLTVDPGGQIRVQVPLPEGGGAIYSLGFDLRLQEFRFSDNFIPMHERYHRQRLLDHALSPAETASLGTVISLAAAPDGNSPELTRRWKF